MFSLRQRIEAELLPQVEKPMRYLGNEINIIRKDLSKVRLHGVLCFPDLYDIGMSHYGTQLLYHVVNAHEDWALSRCYHPWVDAEKNFRKTGIPLYSLEYLTPICEADFIGFTIQSELQATNLVNMLDLAGVPLLASERKEGDTIVIAGGPSLLNPEPFADFLDACVIGDGEKALVDVCNALEEHKNKGARRSETLRQLESIQGVYVPSMHATVQSGMFIVAQSPNGTPVQPARIADLHGPSRNMKPLVPLIDVVHHRLAVEVQRGCTRGCRFCSAGFYYRPVRERSAVEIQEQIQQGVETSGWREVGLLSLSTADHSQFTDVLEALSEIQEQYKLDVSIPSTRIDSLTDDQIGLLNRAFSSSSFTLAPEAGSQRLRNAINKDFSDEAIFRAVENLLDRKVQTIKLYFMIGLPTETDEDIESLVSLVERISDLARKKGKRRVVNVALSPFSPKPHTPFQWEEMSSPQSLIAKGQKVKGILRNRRNVKVNYRDPYMTYLETVIARGDRSVGALIRNAWENGARFDGWDERFSIDPWREAQNATGVSMDTFAASISEDQALPWDAVSVGVNRQFLNMERCNALAGQTTPDCRTGACTACGVCGIVPRHFASTSETKPHADHPPAATEGPEMGEKFYRLVYRKGRPVRFLSHRDIINLVNRAFVAAGVPVAYSQGYHPHPRISFGPALPLGYMAERELLDVTVVSEYVIEIDTLNRWFPQGLELLDLIALEGKPKSLNVAITSGRYTIELPESIEHETAASAVETFNSQSQAVVLVEKKRSSSDVDIRPLVHDLRVSGDTHVLDAVLSLKEGAACRPVDLLKYLFHNTDPQLFVVSRTECRQVAPDGSVFIQ